MKQPRRARYEGLTHDQAVRALADDFDELEGILDEHADEDEAAFKEQAKAIELWTLNSLRSQNRMLFAVVLALITALAGIIVPLVIR